MHWGGDESSSRIKVKIYMEAGTEFVTCNKVQMYMEAGMRVRHVQKFNWCSNVSPVLLATRNARARPVPLLNKPKTHVPWLLRPRLYLRLWPNIDSSISTVFCCNDINGQKSILYADVTFQLGPFSVLVTPYRNTTLYTKNSSPPVCPVPLGPTMLCMLKDKVSAKKSHHVSYTMIA